MPTVTPNSPTNIVAFPEQKSSTVIDAQQAADALIKHKVPAGAIDAYPRCAALLRQPDITAGGSVRTRNDPVPESAPRPADLLQVERIARLSEAVDAVHSMPANDLALAVQAAKVLGRSQDESSQHLRAGIVALLKAHQSRWDLRGDLDTAHTRVFNGLDAGSSEFLNLTRSIRLVDAKLLQIRADLQTRMQCATTPR
jgi:hypothetical protein